MNYKDPTLIVDRAFDREPPHETYDLILDYDGRRYNTRF
jgi:hypothetical protein